MFGPDIAYVVKDDDKETMETERDIYQNEQNTYKPASLLFFNVPVQRSLPF